MPVCRSPARFTSSPWSTALCGLLVLVIAQPVAAQYSVGASPIVSARGEIPPREDLESSWEDARWSLGALRVQPWVGLDQVGFVTNQELTGLDPGQGDGQGEGQGDGQGDAAPPGESTDFTATLGAGVRGYVRLGSDLMLAAHVLPEYVWWREADERSGVGGRYGAGLFAHWNRLHVGLSHRWEERQGFYNAEVQVLTRLRQETSRAEVEIEVLRDLWLYAAAEERAFEETGDTDQIFRRLDREESSLEVGLRLLSDRGLSLSAGVREQETDFESTARPLSNDENAIVFAGSWEGQRFDLALGLAARELEATSGSVLRDIDETTGGLLFTLHTSDRSDLFLLADRALLYSIDAAASTFLEERVGAGFGARFGLVRTRLLAAQGEVEVTGLATGGVGRVDEFTEVALDVTVEARRLASVGAVFTWRDYQSDDPRFDRDVAQLGVRLDLGTLFEALNVGESGAVW